MCKVTLIFVVFVAAVDCAAIGFDDRLKVVEKIVKNETKIDKKCVDDFVRIYSRNFVVRQVLSSWSKFKLNQKFGNSHDFGDFVGCKSINETKLSTQYCLIQFFDDSRDLKSVQPAVTFFQKEFMDLDVTFLNAVCVPDSCSSKDVGEIVKMTIDGHRLKLGSKIYCKSRINEKSKKLFGQFDASIFDFLNFERILIFTALIIMSTAFQFLNINSLKMTSILEYLFSINSNSMSYLNGIKAICSIFVIVFHTPILRILFPFKNGRDIASIMPSSPQLIVAPFLLSIFSVELFFVIGGVLTAKSLAKEFRDCNKFKWLLKFYVKRVLRLLPVIILIMALILTSQAEHFAPYSFPLEKENVKKFWWAFFIQDWISPYDSFAQYSWFLAVLLKLSLVTPFAFLAMRNEKFGIFATAAIILACIACRYVYSFNIMQNIANVIKFGIDKEKDLYFYHRYISTPYRFLSFFIGMAVEEFLNEKLQVFKLIKINLKAAAGCYSFFLLVAVIIVNTENFSQILPPLDVFMCLMLPLMFYVLHFSDNWLKTFLSHRFWSPISRMSLSIYLISGFVQFGIHKRQLEPLEIQGAGDWLLACVTDLSLIALPVFLTFLLVEEPISRVGELIAKKL